MSDNACYVCETRASNWGVQLHEPNRLFICCLCDQKMMIHLADSYKSLVLSQSIAKKKIEFEKLKNKLMSTPIKEEFNLEIGKVYENSKRERWLVIKMIDGCFYCICLSDYKKQHTGHKTDYKFHGGLIGGYDHEDDLIKLSDNQSREVVL